MTEQPDHSAILRSVERCRGRTSAPTIADVARLAGVGAITVSRVINGNSYVNADPIFGMCASAIKEFAFEPGYTTLQQADDPQSEASSL